MQGRGLEWAGVGRDTLYQALALQLKEHDVQARNYNFVAVDEPTDKGALYPEAARQIRIDVLRSIAKIPDQNQRIGENIELQAAAQRYLPIVVCIAPGKSATN